MLELKSIKVVPHGGIGVESDNISGSCTELIIEEISGKITSILLDCGKNEQFEKSGFPFDPKKINFVIPTHSHIDHCGLIPLLYKQEGFNGNIITNVINKKLMQIMLRDSVLVMSRDLMLLKNKIKELKKTSKINSSKLLSKGIKSSKRLEDFVHQAKLSKLNGDNAQNHGKSQLIELADSENIETGINDYNNLILLKSVLDRFDTAIDFEYELIKLSSQKEIKHDLINEMILLIINNRNKDHFVGQPPSFDELKNLSYNDIFELLKIVLEVSIEEVTTQTEEISIDDEDSFKEGLLKAQQKILYTQEEVTQTLNATKAINYYEKTEISPGIFIEFYKASHVIGSCLTVIEITQKNGKPYRLLFSGDIGKMINFSFLGKPDIPTGEFDFILIESTYGGRFHTNRKNDIDKMAIKINEISKDKGKIIIPCFMLQRLQDVALLLTEIIDNYGLREYNAQKYLGKVINDIENIEFVDELLSYKFSKFNIYEYIYMLPTDKAISMIRSFEEKFLKNLNIRYKGKLSFEKKLSKKILKQFEIVAKKLSTFSSYKEIYKYINNDNEIVFLIKSILKLSPKYSNDLLNKFNNFVQKSIINLMKQDKEAMIIQNEIFKESLKEINKNIKLIQKDINCLNSIEEIHNYRFICKMFKDTIFEIYFLPKEISKNKFELIERIIKNRINQIEEVNENEYLELFQQNSITDDKRPLISELKKNLKKINKELSEMKTVQEIIDNRKNSKLIKNYYLLSYKLPKHKAIELIAKLEKTILYSIYELDKTRNIDFGNLQNIKIFGDGGQLNDINDVFKRLSNDFSTFDCSIPNIYKKMFEHPNVKFFSKRIKGSDKLSKNDFFKTKSVTTILLASSGMMEGGMIYNYLEALQSPNNGLFFVGYQANGTLGRRIQDGEKIVNIPGQFDNLVIRSKINTFRSFSSHGDHDDIIAFLKEIGKKNDTKIAINHGIMGKSQFAIAVGIKTNKLVDESNIIEPNLGDQIDLIVN